MPRSSQYPRLNCQKSLKFLLGVCLLPLCWIFSQTFFSCFAHETLEHQFWATEGFWFFSMGVIMWLIVFFGLPRPLLLYVFGHELTHALWVWLLGGRVSAFRVRRDGGYIISDTNNVLISLAPYFFPLYSIAVMALWGALFLFHIDPWPYRRWFFALIGATWAFHLTFTCWMILKNQPDLVLHGTFFSLVIIYLVNLTVLSSFFIFSSPHASWAQFGTSLVNNTLDLYDLISTRASFLLWHVM